MNRSCTENNACGNTYCLHAPAPAPAPPPTPSCAKPGAGGVQCGSRGDSHLEGALQGRGGGQAGEEEELVGRRV